MATMQITKVGYDRILDSLNNMIKLKITTVKVGDATGYKPSKEEKDLHGNILWSGPIANCDVITDEVMDFLCVIPEHMGSNNVSIGEIGLYLDTGELFAVGVYSNPFSKAPNLRFKTHCLVLSPYLGSAVDLTLTWTMSLPRVNYYGTLPKPTRTGDNAYVVNYGTTHKGKVAPTIVTRYAKTPQGPLAWALMNGTLYYDGYLANITTDTFLLAEAPTSSTPYHLIDFAFIYVYDGTGYSQCRAIDWDADINKFRVLYEDFSIEMASSLTPASANPCDVSSPAAVPIKVLNLDSTSKVMIWSLPYTEASGLWYQGRWDATAGFPPNAWAGSYWVINVGGVLGGDGLSSGVSYQPGDWLVYEGQGVWDKVDNTELPYVLFKGTWDASTGTFPPATPTTIFTALRQGHYYRITVEGTIGGRHFNVDDLIIYEGAGNWYRLKTPYRIVAGDGIRIDVDPDTEVHTIVNIGKVYEHIATINDNMITNGAGNLVINPSPIGAQPTLNAATLHDTVTLEAGNDIQITASEASAEGGDILRIDCVRPMQFGFTRVQPTNTVAGIPLQGPCDADQAFDTLTLRGGSDIIITSDPTQDLITISSVSITHPIWSYYENFNYAALNVNQGGHLVTFDFNPWVAAYNAQLNAAAAVAGRAQNFAYQAADFNLAVLPAQVGSVQHWHYLSHADANYGANDYEHEHFIFTPTAGDPLRFSITIGRYFRAMTGGGQYAGTCLACGFMAMVLFGHRSVFAAGPTPASMRVDAQTTLPVP